MKRAEKIEYYKKLERLAAEGRFDEASIPYNSNNLLPVDENYEFLPKNIFFRMFSACIRAVLQVAGPIVNFFDRKPKIVGRKHLKGIKSAITVSNHVFHLDNLVVRQAVRGHKLYVTVAPFNCKKGVKGLFLRAGGILPFSSGLPATKNLYKSIEILMKKGAYVHVYPEQSMWLEYENSRPLKKAAFSIAVKNNVPVIPMFFVFRPKKGLEKIFHFNKIAMLKILEPVYPDCALSHGENVERISAMVEEGYNRVITDYYGKDS